MKKHFSEHRLCFRDGAPDIRDGDPQWSFGDLPIGSEFQFADGIRDDTNRYTKDEEHRASVVIREGKNVRLTGNTSPEASTRIKNPVIPTVEDIRGRFTRAMQQPNSGLPPPQELLLAFERETLADAERARLAAEHGGLPYGPTKNPSDKLREYVDWSTVPRGSFFCIPQNPAEHAPVYLRIAGDYVIKVCTFGQWVQGLKGFTISTKQLKLSEALDYSPRRMDELKVNVLYAETPDEFERMLANAKAKPDASPPSERNDAHHQKLREHLAAFWAGVEERNRAS